VYALIIMRQLETGLPGVEPIGVDEAPSSSRMPVVSVQPPRPGAANRSAVGGHGEARSASGSIPAQPTHAGGTRSPSSDPPAASPPPFRPVESPEQAAFRAEIRERAARGGESYYDLLGVAPDAIPSVIQGAFFQLAKKWHPDRLGPDLADVKDLATKVFARMSEAHQILSDPSRRKEYDEVRKDGGGSAEEQEQVQRVIRAATAFQKAEVLMKRNNMAAALEEAKKALELDPSQADYIALLAWLEASQLNPNLDDIFGRIEKATRMEPNNTRIRWYRGLILKRMGKNGKAVGDFRFIVENDPRHVDAQREIRLYEMRRAEMRRTGQKSPSDRPSGPPGAGSTPPPSGKPGEGGRFGKWFKR
jgi:curved DNA-binding protein CbpA